jgi:hypothetical protein
MRENNKPRVYSSEILKDMISKITPEELSLTEIEMTNMVYEDTYTNKEIRTWWLNQTEERRRDMVREYFKGGNSENINTLYGIMPEEMEEMYNVNTGINKNTSEWCKIFDEMRVSPYIDMKGMRDCDVTAIVSWLSSNYHFPITNNNPYR